jgi:transcription factor C subunit 3
MELLSILRDLRLITPLQQSQSDTPFLTCEENGGHPSSFDVVPQASWSTSAANLAPKYWHIRASAPIHHWASSENPPPFWKTFPLRTATEGEGFWKNLREVSLGTNSVEEVHDGEVPPEDQPNLVIRNSLRRDAGWLATYYISSHQESFLNQSLDDPPLSDDEETKKRLAHLSWVSLAPQSVIKRFYATALDRRAQQLQRRRKEEKSQSENRALVAQKAARGKDKRVKLWDQLLANSHPALVGKPLPPRVQRVRTEFLKAPSVADNSQWEKKIVTAIQEEGTNQSLHLANRPRPKGPTAVSFPSGSATEKSIAQLLGEQNKIQSLSEAPVRKRKDKSGQPNAYDRQRPFLKMDLQKSQRRGGTDLNGTLNLTNSRKMRPSLSKRVVGLGNEWIGAQSLRCFLYSTRTPYDRESIT